MLTLKPEVEAGLLAHAQAAGLTLEEYLLRLVEKDVPIGETQLGNAEESGMVWEDGLLIYSGGPPLPAGFVEETLRRSRAERSLHILGGNFV